MDFVKPLPNVLYHSDVDEKGKCMAISINRSLLEEFYYRLKKSNYLLFFTRKSTRKEVRVVVSRTVVLALRRCVSCRRWLGDVLRLLHRVHLLQHARRLLRLLRVRVIRQRRALEGLRQPVEHCR